MKQSAFVEQLLSSGGKGICVRQQVRFATGPVPASAGEKHGAPRQGSVVQTGVQIWFGPTGLVQQCWLPVHKRLSPHGTPLSAPVLPVPPVPPVLGSPAPPVVVLADVPEVDAPPEPVVALVVVALWPPLPPEFKSCPPMVTLSPPQPTYSAATQVTETISDAFMTPPAKVAYAECPTAGFLVTQRAGQRENSGGPTSQAERTLSTSGDSGAERKKVSACARAADPGLAWQSAIARTARRSSASAPRGKRSACWSSTSRARPGSAARSASCASRSSAISRSRVVCDANRLGAAAGSGGRDGATRRGAVGAGTSGDSSDVGTRFDSVRSRGAGSAARAVKGAVAGR